MSSTLPLALILLAVLIVSFIFLVRAEGGFDKLPDLFDRGFKYLNLSTQQSTFMEQEDVATMRNGASLFGTSLLCYANSYITPLT